MSQHNDKTLDPDTTNRLVIFCFYDRNGHAAKFIPRLLEGLMPHLRRLVVIVNGKLDDESRAMFERFTQYIIVRDNAGLDTGAYKQALLQVGWDQLAQFDEVICMNDTCLGPVYPFSEMFAEMAKRPVDFWGITAYAGEKVSELETFPTHVQAYWHAYRHSLVTSTAFQEYWETMEPSSDYAANTRQHEIPFTLHFENLGFTWDTYVDWRKYKKYSSYPLMFMPMELLRDDRCPVFKRRLFFESSMLFMEHTAGQAMIELYEFLHDRTDYDTDLIWDALLQSYNVADLRQSMHLDYVLPTHAVNPVSPSTPKLSSAFLFNIAVPDALDVSIRYVANVPDDTDLYIVTQDELMPDVKKALDAHGITRDVQFLPTQARGREAAALLVASRDVVLSGKYDVIGFAHDHMLSNEETSRFAHGSVALSVNYKLLENTVGSPEFVRNVLGLFAKNACLGQVCPPQTYHSVYFHAHHPTDWNGHFEGTQTLLGRLGISVPLDPSKSSVSALCNCLWFRPDALRPLFEYAWDYEDFAPTSQTEDGSVVVPDEPLVHQIARANGYVAQSRGYYPAFAMTDSFARIETDSLTVLLDSLLAALPADHVGNTPTETVRLQNTTKIAVRSTGKLVHRGIRWAWRHTFGRLPAPIAQPIAAKGHAAEMKVVNAVAGALHRFTK